MKRRPYDRRRRKPAGNLATVRRRAYVAGMELQQLRCFAAVARHLNFSRAAEEMHLTQPTLSRAIQALETELGVRLFERNRQCVLATDAGRALFARTEKILAEMDMAVHAVRAVAAGEGGELIVGRDWRMSFGFMQDSIAEFHRRQPQAEVTLLDLLVHELLGALRARKIHLAFVPSEFVSLDDRMERLQVQTCAVAVVLPARDKLARRRRVALRELAQKTWMVPASPGPGYKTFFARICRQAGFTPNYGKTATTAEGMLSQIAAGYGVSLLPRAALPKLGRSLRAVSVDCEPLTLQAVWLRDTHSLLLDRYLDVLRAGLSA